ncbi:hemerythrin domain-containing protein [Ferruginibacter paludis]|uniref:hemerythrin domain-containing protein n=1 Tax=Ferruginibacter paludis TaxID=1310417 RepID=UPI0025B49FBF|nr:hemerythrin domain-containing protein [Ferruginibacter paludis]MDN3656892.1 hemerythrin domain-containing protein [Ferruginibacter paludis]
MQRYNVFYQVHKGLRELLYTTGSLLQQTDFDNAEERESALQQVRLTADLFDKHAHTEDNFVLPDIASHDASVSDLFAAEHVQDHALGERLRALLAKLELSALDTDSLQTGCELRIAFTDFLVFNLNHMAKEEVELNRLLWQHYTDAQLHGLTQKILAHIAPADLQIFSSWMMRGLSNNEVIGWLKEIKNNAPEVAFTAMLNLAEKELPATRWHLVQDCITEGAMIA